MYKYQTRVYHINYHIRESDNKARGEGWYKIKWEQKRNNHKKPRTKVNKNNNKTKNNATKHNTTYTAQQNKTKASGK